MSKNQIRIGRVMGIPLRLDISWLLIFIWVTWSLAAGYFPQRYPEWAGGLRWSLAVLTSLMFFGSVLLHELGHALLARKHGVPVKDITLFIFGGVAEIADEPGTPIQELTMAVAGPFVSLSLSGLFAAIHLATRSWSAPIAALGLFLGGVNLSLGIFNLIPGFPLDGGRVLRSILWHIRQDLVWATRWASHVGQGVAYLFIAYGIIRTVAGNWLGGLWIAFIGFFLENAARTAYAQLTLRNLMDGHVVAEAMNRQCQIIPPQLTLDLFVEHYLLNGGRRCYVVGDRDEIMGLLTVHNIRSVPRLERPFIQARDVLTPMDKLISVSVDTPLWEALREMTAGGVNQLPVMEDGKLQGMLTREDLITFIKTRAELDV
ncbi:MAG TPA: CBS domain-containing protein [Chloroflexi bacterium]|nr:CBS domain-containing protein [Chloroflexota bacterium]